MLLTYLVVEQMLNWGLDEYINHEIEICSVSLFGDIVEIFMSVMEMGTDKC